MSPRPSKSECLSGFRAAVGAIGHLGEAAFVESDRFAPPARVGRGEADHLVGSERGLRRALDAHDPGDVIWVDDEIVLDGVEDLRTESVTLASGYGLPDAATGRLVSTTKPRPLLRAGDDVRITGLRIHGDEFEHFDPSDRFPQADDPIYEVGASCGVIVEGDGVRLDCLEVSGWTFAGISVRRDGRADTRTHVHHVDLVDNPADTLGYGIAVREGVPLVEHAYLDNNRHSVAGSGWENCGYVLRHSVVGNYHSSHAIDMHGENRGGYDYPIAGRRLSVRGNVVKQRSSFLDGSPTSAVKVRGRPIERSQVIGNWLFDGDATDGDGGKGSAIRQLYAPADEYRNVRVAQNVYGTTPQ